MAANGTVGKFVRVSPELKRALVAEVEARGSNMTAVATAALCAHFGIAYEPAGRRSSPGRSTNILLRIPGELNEAIRAAAYAQRTDEANIIRRVLSERFGVRYLAPSRGRRRKRRARAAA